jgi:hypothetical protein
MDGDEIREISHCYLFETEKKSTKNTEPVYIEINHDDRIDFEKTPEYLELYNATMHAFSEIAKTPPLILNLEDLAIWVEKYSDLYKSIDENDEYNLMQMKWDIFLEIYSSLKSIHEFMNSDLIEILVANNLFELISNEEVLIEWVINNEAIFNQIPYGIVYLTEEDNTVSCPSSYSNSVNFIKEPFEQVLKFIASYKKHEEELLEKYNTYTNEEYNEVQNSEAHLFRGSNLFSLQFHLNKRKELASLGITLPFYLGKS